MRDKKREFQGVVITCSQIGWNNIMVAVYLEICFQIMCDLNDDNFNMYDRELYYDYIMRLLQARGAMSKVENHYRLNVKVQNYASVRGQDHRKDLQITLFLPESRRHLGLSKHIITMDLIKGPRHEITYNERE